jgi:hypothetical protein
MFQDDENRVVDLLRQMEQAADPAARKTLGILIEETLAFRDWLVANNQPPLTVGDTRAALEAFEMLIQGKQLPSELTEQQRTLLARWYERITREQAKDDDSGDDESAE